MVQSIVRHINNTKTFSSVCSRTQLRMNEPTEVRKCTQQFFFLLCIEKKNTGTLSENIVKSVKTRRELLANPRSQKTQMLFFFFRKQITLTSWTFFFYKKRNLLRENVNHTEGMIKLKQTETRTFCHLHSC